MATEDAPTQAATDASSTAEGRSTRRKAALAATIGTLLEYYDYYIFGLAAATVFPRLFFPAESSAASQLASFATFAVGFLLRPIGAIVLGHVADRFGRKTALVITILMMGLGTLAMGLLPSYQTIGIWAPILLVFFRLVQGFSTGGEMGGATALIVEHSRTDRRGLGGALLLSGAGVALLISSGLMNLMSTMSDDAFMSWGWRVPFWLSVLLLVAGLVIRAKVPETEAFKKDVGTKSQQKPSRLPLLSVLRKPKNLIFGILFGFANSIGGYVFTTYGLAYLENRGESTTIGLTATMVAAGVQVVLAPTWGLLSDRIGRKPVFIAGCVALAAFAIPFFWMMDTGNIVVICVAMVLGQSVCVMSMSALAQTILAELFSTESRSTGVNMGYQLTAVLGGGFAPLIATALASAAGGSAWLVSVYLIVACVVSTITISLVPEGSRQPLQGRA